MLTSSGRVLRNRSRWGTQWLMRASLPINTFAVPPAQNHETGISDLNLFAINLMDIGVPTISFGFGPQITAPTAGEDALGSGKWSAEFVPVRLSAFLAVVRGLIEPQVSIANKGPG